MKTKIFLIGALRSARQAQVGVPLSWTVSLRDLTARACSCAASIGRIGGVPSTFAALALFAAGAAGQTCVSLTCPTNVVQQIPCGVNCVVMSSYPPIMASNVCNPADLTVSYDPPPGTCFSRGTTPVVVTAYGSGQTNSCTFLVTILPNDGCPTSLPVYTVTQSGAQPPQAAALAGSLGIPAGGYVLTNGQMDYLDPANFIAAPVMPMTDPAAQSALLADTVNKVPGIPIRFEQLDFPAMAAMTVPSSNNAVASFSAGLANAGLTPQSATPLVSHATLTAFFTNESETLLSASNSLDTEVNYQLTLAGFPVVGPGAQVQVAYGHNGAVTRLHYAARQLAPGPAVSLIPPTVASNLAATIYGALNAQVNVQLVYYAPPLSLNTVSNLIPWYLCGGTMSVTNPSSGQVSALHLKRALIPATGDTNFVPTLALSAMVTGGGTQVVATASVTGGAGPYGYLWSGSAPNLFSNTSSRLTYTPVTRESPAQLFVSGMAAGSMTLSWVDPLQLYQIESAPQLTPGSWSPLPNGVTWNDGVASVTVDTTSQAEFFRLVLLNQPVPAIDTVGLSIVDRNGVFVRMSRNLGVLAMPLVTLGSGSVQAPCWGTDAPYDQDLDAWDTSSWRQSMQNNSAIFGAEQFDKGTYIARPQDFIAPPHGWNDYAADSADIVYYLGHGNPNAITFTYSQTGPGKPFFVLYNNATYLKGSWGIRQGRWLALLSCEVLAQRYELNSDYLAFVRWGPAFDGLHMMLGFADDAYAGGITGIGGDSFETVFIKAMADQLRPGWPQTIQQAWFYAAQHTGPLWQGGGVGHPAFLGPIAIGGAWDFNDFWWGKGPVGPTIRSPNIRGWFYLSTE